MKLKSLIMKAIVESDTVDYNFTLRREGDMNILIKKS